MGSSRPPWITRKGEIDAAEPARGRPRRRRRPCWPAAACLTRAPARRASQRRQSHELPPAGGHAPSVARVRLAQGLAWPILGKKGMVGLAYLGRFLVIDERQEGITGTARHLRHRMQKRAGEHHGPARCRLEAPRSILGKAHLTALE